MGTAAKHSKVLIVDDNEDVVAALAQWLELHDYDVVAATSGLQAISMFEQHRPDIVVLDLAMPVMDGFDVARKLRSLYGRSFALVAHSAFGDEPTRARTASEGFDAHVTKGSREKAMAELLDAIAVAQSPFR